MQLAQQQQVQLLHLYSTLYHTNSFINRRIFKRLFYFLISLGFILITNSFSFLNYKFLRHTVAYALLIVSSNTVASVTMIGSRIIYPEGQYGVDVELKNPDTIPYAVQGWFDSGDDKSTPKTGNAPFIASPMLFRVMPGSGQVVRVLFTGNASSMPQDHESVFYFNFLQVPPSNVSENTVNSQNKMLIMLKNRVKVFYRPKSILSKLKSFPDLIDVKTSFVNGDLEVIIKNPSAFHLSLSSVYIQYGDRKLMQRSDMIKPFSQRTHVFKNIGNNNRITTTIEYINDQGARIKKEYAEK